MVKNSNSEEDSDHIRISLHDFYWQAKIASKPFMGILLEVVEGNEPLELACIFFLSLFFFPPWVLGIGCPRVSLPCKKECN